MRKSPRTPLKTLVVLAARQGPTFVPVGPKYDAVFQAFEKVYDGREFPALGRKGYAKSAYIDLAGDARTQARLRRRSQSFRETCDLRTEVERYFSRVGPREIEDATLYKYG